MSFVVQALSTAAAQKEAADSLFKTLQLRVNLNNATNKAAKDAAAKALLTIPPSNAPSTQNQQKVSDRFYQRDLAMINLQEMLDYKNAQSVIEWLEKTNQVEGFNSFFPKFKEEYKGVKNLNYLLFQSLWQKFREKIEKEAGFNAIYKTPAGNVAEAFEELVPEPDDLFSEGMTPVDMFKYYEQKKAELTDTIREEEAKIPDEGDKKRVIAAYRPAIKRIDDIINALRQMLEDVDERVSRAELGKQRQLEQKERARLMRLEREEKSSIQKGDNAYRRYLTQKMKNKRSFYRYGYELPIQDFEYKSSIPIDEAQAVRKLEDMAESKLFGSEEKEQPELQPARTVVAKPSRKSSFDPSKLQETEIMHVYTYNGKLGIPEYQQADPTEAEQKNIDDFLEKATNNTITRDEMNAYGKAILALPEREIERLSDNALYIQLKNAIANQQFRSNAKFIPFTGERLEYAKKAISTPFANLEDAISDYKALVGAKKSTKEMSLNQIMVVKPLIKRIIFDRDIRDKLPNSLYSAYNADNFDEVIQQLKPIIQKAKMPSASTAVEVPKMSAEDELKEIDDLIGKLKKGIPKRDAIQRIAHYTGKTVNDVNETLGVQGGKDDLVKELEFAKLTSSFIEAEEPAASSAVSSAMQALLDFYSEKVPDKVGNYQKAESRDLLRSAKNKILDPDNWKKGGIQKNEIPEMFSKFYTAFEKPKTISSSSGADYLKVEYLEKWIEKNKTMPNKKILTKINSWDGELLDDELKKIAIEEVRASI
jgi:hypothetical protein